MLNQIVLVGRLAKEIVVVNEKVDVTMTLAIPSSEKNSKGEYDTDFIDVVLSGEVAKNAANYCKKNDIIGVKGKVKSFPKTNDNDFQAGREIQIIAEKVTFLSSKSE